MPSLSRRAVVALAAVPAIAAPVALVSVSADANVNATGTSVSAPLVFGHRGASGYRPEHTLASYDLAVRQGADVIEPDLVSTKDGVLVARHENEISGTTDVADHPEFASRRTTKVIDGSSITGWFTEDFTLAELRTLRAKERLPAVRQENTALDGRYVIPTFGEVLDFAKRASKETGRDIGVAPETKHPTYFDSIGLSLEEPLVKELRDRNIDKRNKNIWIQSFEESNLRQLHELFRVKVGLVQLTSAAGRPYDHVVSGDPQTYAQMTSAEGLREVAEYADVVGPDKSQIYPRAANGTTGAPSALVADAHAAGLKVVPYTVRAENQFLPVQYRKGTDPTAYGDVLAEFEDLYEAGVDGIFADQPDLAYAAREDFLGYQHGVTHPQAETPRG
ncbi:glycerophosphodiester phosphodiesterase [Motilibacter aurantiacus]|uniref:glycerophosphodiester phosphodiesterase n=1 Tax=Motilibacter aurantiacus TaxID=2714955 RepID=UPI00140DCA1C|nr:glycerophosphodiester phosphodiesterase [Motilibacter aurantiacus]NHC47217.1 glycerophosphodiester phosphodiesterase [Motilibacter aurantiacus]